VTRGWFPQKAGSPIPVGGGDAATVLPNVGAGAIYLSTIYL